MGSWLLPKMLFATPEPSGKNNAHILLSSFSSLSAGSAARTGRRPEVAAHDAAAGRFVGFGHNKAAAAGGGHAVRGGVHLHVGAHLGCVDLGLGPGLKMVAGSTRITG